MFSLVQLANSSTDPASVAFKRISKISLEQQLAGKGLMVGVAMEQNRVCLKLVGKLNSANSLLFKELVKTSLNHGYTSLVLDLEGLIKLDSAGVAVLVALNVAATQAGGELSVTNPTPALFRELIKVNFHQLVQIDNFNYAA